jgi:hypothetical protein
VGVGVTLYKVIVNGTVYPKNNLTEAAEQVAQAKLDEARKLRVRAVDNFPASARERDLTQFEFTRVVELAADIIEARTAA